MDTPNNMNIDSLIRRYPQYELRIRELEERGLGIDRIICIIEDLVESD